MAEVISIEQTIRRLLSYYDLKGTNFEDTPRRVKRVYDQLLNTKMPELRTFPLRGKPGMILIDNYIGWSMCPQIGRAHV